jgi:microsomal dipeptidase-like Zn-dependent dipeptidase
VSISKSSRPPWRLRDMCVLSVCLPFFTYLDAGATNLSLQVPVISAATQRPALVGFVDLHTHPLANLGFGGKLLYGGVDIGAMLPADPNCNQTRLFDNPPKVVRATSVDQALGHDNSTHGGWDLFKNQCGDGAGGVLAGLAAGIAGALTFGVGTAAETAVVGGGYVGGQFSRPNFIHVFQKKLGGNDPPDDAEGYPDFTNWPTWNDLTHQKMWVEWIQRAVRGGLRVMVALAVNNKTLADSASGSGDGPQDDRASADLQIDETKRFVGRHPDFMEIAYSSADVQRIVSQGRLAVILGVEIDDIGDMYLPIGVPATPQGAAAEIDRLYGEGVRYIFPIHLLDNKFGGTATYIDIFNLSNYRERGSYYALKCVSTATDQVDWRPDPSIDPLLWVFMNVKLGLNAPTPPVPPCNWATMGVRNQQGLTDLGKSALQRMMQRGMLIDIDHMSQESVNMALSQAEKFGYPLNSGHNGLRGLALAGQNSERSFTAQTYRRIYQLHGMVGIGSAKLDAYSWVGMYEQVIGAMETPSILGWRATGAFGTDTDGLEFGMPSSTPFMEMKTNPNYVTCYNQWILQNCPGQDQTAACQNSGQATCAKKYPTPTLVCTANCAHRLPPVQYSNSLPMSSLGNKTWDYNVEGVAHYGMLWDFLVAVSSIPSSPPTLKVSGADLINNNLMNGAQYFYDTWHIAEQRSAMVPWP